MLDQRHNLGEDPNGKIRRGMQRVPGRQQGGCAITQQTIEWLKSVFPGRSVSSSLSSMRRTLRLSPPTTPRCTHSPVSDPYGRLLLTTVHADPIASPSVGRGGRRDFVRTIATRTWSSAREGTSSSSGIRYGASWDSGSRRSPDPAPRAVSADSGPVCDRWPVSASRVQDSVSVDPEAGRYRGHARSDPHKRRSA